MARMVRMAGMTRFHRFPTFRFGLWLVLAVSLPGLGVAFGASSEGPAGAAPTVPDSRAGGSRLVLPDPVIHPHSAEICSNSRISYHGGWSAGATESMLANVLFAAGRAPVTGGSRTIYVATASNVSIYDPASHSLILHKSGDWREDSSASFEVGIAAEQIVDAGAAMHLAQLESVTTWTGTANQLASCPRASATTYANGHWSPVEPIDIVISFGMRSVPGLTTTLVATSSDGSLPDPHTDGTVYMDDVLHDLAYGSSFADEDLSLDQVSQILWAAYGCSDHRAAGSKAGLTVSSAVANYYLTRRIYWVGPDGVFRYHNRLPPGTDATTRDHRIEQVQSGDARPALRGQVPGLPEAPGYLIACSGTATDWAVLECGFAAVGGVLQASSIGLQGWLRAGLTGQEQAGIRSATGIPSADLPWVIVCAGRSGDASAVEEDARATAEGDLSLIVENPPAAGGSISVRYRLPGDCQVDLAVHDASGQRIVALVGERQGAGDHRTTWDGRDERGRAVASGVYFVHLKAGEREATSQVTLLR